MNVPKTQKVLCLGSDGNPATAPAVGQLIHELRAAGYDAVEHSGPLPEERPALIIVFGGDGFLMETLRNLGYPTIPILGANFGTVGFLMNRRELLPDFVRMIEEWDFQEEEHAVLQARVTLRDGSAVEMSAFNDFVVERMTRQSIRLELHLDGVLFNHYAGDGIVLSTAAGSTAYNLAAGGPVIHPSIQVILVTPLYPHRAAPFHSLQFSLVVPLGTTLKVVASNTPKRSMRIVGDGRPVEHATSVEVRDSGSKIRLLRPKSHLFVKTLGQKFIGEQ